MRSAVESIRRTSVWAIRIAGASLVGACATPDPAGGEVAQQVSDGGYRDRASDDEAEGSAGDARVTCMAEVLSTEEFCSGDCPTLADERCGAVSPPVRWQVLEGCGYVKFLYIGDLGDYWLRIYSTVTGELVSAYRRGSLLDPATRCPIDTSTGVEPECEWMESSWCAVRDAGGD